MSVVGAQLCDETLEYEKDNECCKKCDPGKIYFLDYLLYCELNKVCFLCLGLIHFTNCLLGTRMNQGSSCKDPVCEPCKEGEYQDAYTKDSQCKRQPICDPSESTLTNLINV